MRIWNIGQVDGERTNHADLDYCCEFRQRKQNQNINQIFNSVIVEEIRMCLRWRLQRQLFSLPSSYVQEDGFE